LKRFGWQTSILIAILFVGSTWRAADAAVTIEDDEVIFVLTLPSATNVFLVGDFNNWNPTLEKMEKIGDAFEVRLFLVPGSYRYKFVVDGKWMFDPDNPPNDPSQGSPLVLEERTGMLAMGDAEPEPGEAAPKIEPFGRYIGKFQVDSGETDDDQRFDFFFDFTSTRVAGRAVFRTLSDSWEISPLKAQLFFDYGYLDFTLGRALLKAVQGDTVWTSFDPFNIVGQVGVFDYNAGYERKSFTLALPPILKTRVRLFYGDLIQDHPQRGVTIPGSAFGDFATSTTSDTLVYRNSSALEDEDSGALELHFDTRSFKFGYIRRENRGMHPGTLAQAERDSTTLRVSASNTREFWEGDALWLNWWFAKYVKLAAGYGQGRAYVHSNARSLRTVTTIDSVKVTQDAVDEDREVPLQSSTRWNGWLAYEKGTLAVTLDYLWNRFEFNGPVFVPATAEIAVGALEVDYHGDPWRTGGALRYFDQDYGASPQDFYYLSESRNYWLDYLDRLDAESMVGFDLRRYTNLLLHFDWNAQSPFAREFEQTPGTFSLRSHAEVTANEFFSDIQYVSLRAAWEQRFRVGLYFQVDGRVAWYNKSIWGLDETFFDPYLEVGYRRSWLEFSLGVGFDPVLFDPVQRRYADIGRVRFLRGAIPDPLLREESKLFGERLKLLETLLDDFNALKLEAIVLF
jgi:hypothetical protein